MWDIYFAKYNILVGKLDTYPLCILADPSSLVYEQFLLFIATCGMRYSLVFFAVLLIGLEFL